MICLPVGRPPVIIRFNMFSLGRHMPKQKKREILSRVFHAKVVYEALRKWHACGIKDGDDVKTMEKKGICRPYHAKIHLMSAGMLKTEREDGTLRHRLTEEGLRLAAAGSDAERMEIWVQGARKTPGFALVKKIWLKAGKKGRAELRGMFAKSVRGGRSGLESTIRDENALHEIFDTLTLAGGFQEAEAREMSIFSPEKMSAALKALIEMGWMPAADGSSKEIGETAERFMGKSPDNKSKPDCHGFELKVSKLGEKSFRPFLCEPDSWPETGYCSAEARLMRYGVPCKKGKRGMAMFATVGVKATSAHEWLLSISGDTLSVRSCSSERTMAEWSIDALERRMEEKMSHCAFVKAEKRRSSGGTEIRHVSYRMLSGFVKGKLASLIERGLMKVDFRMRSYFDPKGGRNDFKNHGTSFLLDESALAELYSEELESSASNLQ